jgi:hypothetical protein
VDVSGNATHANDFKVLAPTTDNFGFNGTVIDGGLSEGSVFTVRPNGSLHFDGTDDALRVSYDEFLNLGRTYTLEAYVRPGSNNSGFRSIIDKRNAASNESNFSLSVINGTGVGIFMKNGDDELFLSVPSVLSVGDWSLISASYDGSVMRLYVDGHLVGELDQVVPYNNLEEDLLIGTASPGGEFFNGEIDEVRLWTNALDQIDIVQNVGKPLTGEEFGLIAYYDMNEGVPGGENTSVINLTNGAVVTEARNLDALLENFTLTGNNSNFRNSTAFDISAIAPTVQAVLNEPVPTTNSMDVSWTRGNGDQVVVFMAATDAGTAPIVNNTFYEPSNVFGEGSSLSGQWYCVYNGRGTDVSISGLEENTVYSVAIFESNGPAGFEQYNVPGVTRVTSTDQATPDVVISTLPLTPRNIRQGKTDVLIYKFSIEVSGGAIELGDITLPWGGTSSAADFDGAGMITSTANDLATFNGLIPITGSISPTQILFNVDREMAEGEALYFYVLADISATAGEGNGFRIETPAAADFDIGDPKNIIDTGLASGEVFIIEPRPVVEILEASSIGLVDEMGPGTSGNTVYRFDIRIDNDVNITGITLPFEGNLLDRDVLADGAKLFVNTDENVNNNPGTLLSSADIGVSRIDFNVGQIFSGPEIQADTLLQFWLQLDLETSATEGHFAQFQPSHEDVRFADIVERLGDFTPGEPVTIAEPDIYCDPESGLVTDPTVSPIIERVRFRDIDFTSGSEITEFFNNYAEDQITGLISNTTETLTLDVTASGNGFVKVWVDWDQNLIFDENTELVVNNASYSGSETLNIDIEIPTDAAIGLSRMRIYTYSINERSGGACTGTTEADGEVEDYGISILEPSGATLALPATDIGFFSFTARWASQPGANFYRLDISEDPEFTQLLVENEGVTETEYVLDEGLLYDKNYYYRVRVVYPNSTSVNSNVVVSRTARDPLTAQDSSALVLMYDLNGGNSWSDAGNWKNTNLRLSEWEGVTLTGTRVTALDLSGQGLIGSISDAFVHAQALSALTNLDVSDNDLTGLGALADLAGVTDLNVSGNRLVFTDLEPLVGNYGSLSYTPQQPVGSATETLIPRGESYTVNFTEVVADTYQWQVDGQPISNGDDYSGAATSGLNIFDVNFNTMGDFEVLLTDDDVPGLTLISEIQTVLATGGIQLNVSDLNNLPLDEGTGYLLKIEEPGTPFDTTSVINFVDGDLLFDITILGDYVIAVEADPELYLPTYYEQTFLWEEADTLFFRDVTIVADMRMTAIPVPLDPSVPGNDNIITGILEIEDEELSGQRTDNRRRAGKRRCHVRRRTRAGRGDGAADEFVLIASVETDDNGNFLIENLPDGTYRINFEYPGIPMDPNTFVEFELGTAEDQGQLQLEALITPNGIQVTKIEPVGVQEWFKDIKVYPNPASQELFIQSPGLNVPVSYSMIDLNGREVREGVLKPFVDANEVIKVYDLEAGIYLLNMRNQNTGEWVGSFKLFIRR